MWGEALRGRCPKPAPARERCVSGIPKLLSVTDRPFLSLRKVAEVFRRSEESERRQRHNERRIEKGGAPHTPTPTRGGEKGDIQLFCHLSTPLYIPRRPTPRPTSLRPARPAPSTHSLSLRIPKSCLR